MLISEATAALALELGFALWVVIVVACLVLRAVFKARRLRAIMADREPGAEVRRLARWVRALVVAAIVLGLAGVGAFIEVMGAPQLVVITEDQQIERDLLLVSSSIAIDGHTTTLDHRDGIWIVNRTAIPLRLEAVTYSHSDRGFEPPVDDKVERIAPRSVRWSADAITYLGPHDKPPEVLEISTSGPSTGALAIVSVRRWLTW